jgi:peptide-methionine (S)-S-oxide reductase
MSTLRDRIEDPVLQRAVEAADAGDLTALRALLAAHPDLPSRRARFDDIAYFRAPALLAFVAENPIRNDRLPDNVVEIARAILVAGTTKPDIDETLGLVASGSVARQAGVQVPLIDLLVAHGGDPASALNAALAHGEFEAAKALLRLGAPRTLPATAALDLEDAEALLASASAADRHLAVAFAAQFGRAKILKRLLKAGEDPDRFNPPGAHAHSTPLHQAAWNGHAEAIRVLLDHGARRDLRDTMWEGAAADWARHAGRPEIAALLDEA